MFVNTGVDSLMKGVSEEAHSKWNLTLTEIKPGYKDTHTQKRSVCVCAGLYEAAMM